MQVETPQPPAGQPPVAIPVGLLSTLRSVVDAARTWGITTNSFHRWLHALRVPIVRVGQNSYFHESAFEVALIVLTSPGKPDVNAPGCSDIARGKAKSRRHVLPDLKVAAHAIDIYSRLLQTRTRFLAGRVGRLLRSTASSDIAALAPPPPDPESDPTTGAGQAEPPTDAPEQEDNIQ